MGSTRAAGITTPFHGRSNETLRPSPEPSARARTRALFCKGTDT